MNGLDFFANMDSFMKEGDKAIRRIFGKHIKGNFLVEMKYLVVRMFPECLQYYDFQMNMEKVVTGGHVAFEYDICKMIIGCHSSNTIFLLEEERIKLEKDSDYKKRLAYQVIDNIKLRGYGSSFFRQQPIIKGEYFINYNVPYNLFVISIRMNEILCGKKERSNFFHFYSAISNKALAVLSLLEDNFLDNCYSVCRVVIELYLKLLIFKNHPELIEGHFRFANFEVRQSCCEQEYPEEFNLLFQERINKAKSKKIDYLHYGWVDKIPGYHDKVKKQPYSINGLLTYLKEMEIEDDYYFEEVERLYKMCHGYVHGNIVGAKFPLLHYFEISVMLHYTVFPAYKMLCEEMGLDGEINGIDLFVKEQDDFEVLYNQYLKRTTENFENHYKKRY